MKKWMQEHKNEIIVGVIVFFITSLLSLFLRWIVTSGPKVGNSIFAVLINAIYSSASCASALSVFGIIIITGCSVLIVFVLNLLAKSMKTLKEASALVDIKRKADALKKHGELSDEQKAEVVKSINKLSKLSQKNETSLEKSKKALRISVIGMIASGIIYMTLIVFYIVVPTYMKNNFDLSVTQIAPYIEEKELLELKSKWVSMKTKDDYKEILEYIDDVRQANGIEP